MSDPIFKLQLLARAEWTLTEIYARRAASRTAYLGFAMVLALLGLGMLNLAGYLALAERMSPAAAAFCMALACRVSNCRGGAESARRSLRGLSLIHI